MTAQTIGGAVAAPRPADRRLAGFGALVRKDLTEWTRGFRAWVVLAVTAAFMTLTAANGWITSRLIAALPAGAEATGPGVARAARQPDDGGRRADLRPGGDLRGRQPHRRGAPLGHARLGRLEAGVAERDLAGEVGLLDRDARRSAPSCCRSRPRSRWSSSSTARRPSRWWPGFGAGMIALVAFFAAVGLAAGTVRPGPARGDRGRVRGVRPAARHRGDASARMSRRSCRPRSCPGSRGWPPGCR